MANGVNPIATLQGKVDSQNRLVVYPDGGATGGTSSVDSDPFAVGTDSGTPAMGYVGTDAVAAGEVGVFGMLGNRQGKVTLYDSSGVEVSVGGGTQYDRDTAAGAADKLTMAGVVRADAAASPVGADGDRSVLSHDSAGRLYSRLERQVDGDTGGGTDTVTGIVPLIPASGGAVAIVGNTGTVSDQVQRVTLATDVALPAGTNNIGDVDVLSVVPGTGATNLGKAEDGGHTSGDVGVFALGVRNDTPNAALGADADYTQLSVTKTGAVQFQYSAEDFAVLGSNFVNKPFNLTGAQTDAIIWSPAAGKRWYITSFYYCVSAAAEVTFEDDTAGGDVFVGIGGAHAANSGAACGSLRTPIFSTEDAADLVLTTSAGNIKGFVTGYEI